MTEESRPSRRDFLRASALAAGSMAVFDACTAQGAQPPASTGGSGITGAGPTTAAPQPATPSPTDSWAPQPVKAEGLAMSSLQRGEQLILSTSDGERTFWAGVGLSAALPGHTPQDFAPTPEDYRRWLDQMGQVGVRVVRLDSLQAPALYDALFAYNESHPDAPLYLLQGITVPEVSAPARDNRAFGPELREALTAEIEATSAAVHGELVRRSSAPAPRGSWTKDVSPWIAGWIVGSAWSPGVVITTDRSQKAKPYTGTYIETAPEATPSEAWIAARMDHLATLEAEYGVCAPIAAANSPRTDPLAHPQEPFDDDDLAKIDAAHIRATKAWPAGTFAAYAAYPFAPRFLRTQDSYQGADPYRSYLVELRQHHAGIPLVVTEFGVPASIGRSDNGAAGRNNGFLSEQDAMQINADMLLMFKELGISGGLLASWTDDWSATSPATLPRFREVPVEQRVLMHDAQTSDQWFGIVANDPALAGPTTVHDEPDDEMTRVVIDHDAAYLYMTLYFTRRVTSPVDVGFRLYDADGLRLPGGSGTSIYDIALHFVPTMSTITMYTRRTLDPTRLDGLPTLYLPRTNSRGWVVNQLTMSPPIEVKGGRTMPPEMFRVGELVLGSWDPNDEAFSSLSTWQLIRPDADQPMEWRLRLPWSMLSIVDPAGRRGVVPDLGEPTLVDVSTVDVMVESSTPGSPATFSFDLPQWKTLPPTTERMRAGVDVLTDALTRVTTASD